jgi:hypothetical protein
VLANRHENLDFSNNKIDGNMDDASYLSSTVGDKDDNADDEPVDKISSAKKKEKKRKAGAITPARSSIINAPSFSTPQGYNYDNEYVDRKGNTKQRYIPGMVVTMTTITPMNRACIEKPLRELIWPWYKFFPETTEGSQVYKVASQVSKAIQSKFMGDKYRCLQWMYDHSNVMATMFNSMKNYVISRIKDMLEKHYHENTRTMPNKELLLACGDRTIDLDNDPDGRPNLKHFVLYWDKLLPACTAPNVDSWGRDKCYYTKLSPKNKGITAADEAFLCLCINNYWDRWEKTFELKLKNPACKVKSMATKPKDTTIPSNVNEEYYVNNGKQAIYLWGKYNGKYTITNSGSNRSGGWSTQGKEAYSNFWTKVKKGHKDSNTLVAKEQIVYDFLRSENNISAQTAAEEQRLRQKRRAEVQQALSGQIVPHSETYADSDNSDYDDED